jgi:hypothetical protein
LPVTALSNEKQTSITRGVAHGLRTQAGSLRQGGACAWRGGGQYFAYLNYLSPSFRLGRLADRSGAIRTASEIIAAQMIVGFEGNSRSD